MSSIQDQLSATIATILEQARDFLQCELPESIPLDRPKNRDHGDFATSVALVLAKPSGKAPRAIAEVIAAGLAQDPSIAKVEIAGPGFINITLAQSSQGLVVESILKLGGLYGHGSSLKGVKVNLEFISANPTGPLHLGHTRWAAVGDSLGRTLSAAGASVT